jgi:hypothetical protein
METDNSERVEDVPSVGLEPEETILLDIRNRKSKSKRTDHCGSRICHVNEI